MRNLNIAKCRQIEAAYHANQITYQEFCQGWADAQDGRIIGGIH